MAILQPGMPLIETSYSSIVNRPGHSPATKKEKSTGQESSAYQILMKMKILTKVGLSEPRCITPHSEICEKDSSYS